MTHGRRAKRREAKSCLIEHAAWKAGRRGGSTEDDIFFISTNEWFAAVKLQTADCALGCLLLLQDDPFADGGWASLGLGPSEGPEEGVLE